MLGAAPPPQDDSLGMGDGRTGVKGVIKDRDEATNRAREKREREVEEMRRQMERSAITARTWREDEEERRREKAREEGRELSDEEGEGRARRPLKFGHLREVGMKGFVAAVEEEERGTWVVVHIYEPSLERCDQLDDKLSQLARLYPTTKFLRARASALGFAQSTSAASRRPVGSSINRPKRSVPGDFDEDDPYGDEEGDEDDEDLIDEEDVDLDMLPTMLVYRDGDLVHNWVRVDWEAGDVGMEEFLSRNRVLPSFLHPQLGLDDIDDFFVNL